MRAFSLWQLQSMSQGVLPCARGTDPDGRPGSHSSPQAAGMFLPGWMGSGRLRCPLP